jgi:hypothetical protein
MAGSELNDRTLKDKLTQLLLALTLVINPVSVLAAGSPGAGTFFSPAMVHSSDHPADRSLAHQSSIQQTDLACDMPCCDDNRCIENDVCSNQYNPVALIPQVGVKAPGGEHIGWGIHFDRVPERFIPPDNPPPIEA